MPPLPLFSHERLSTKAILETLRGHERDSQRSFEDLFADVRHTITDPISRAFDHRDQWASRMIFGDSLVEIIPPLA